MNISDETLGAFIDGELDAAGRAQVEAALASAPSIAERIDRMRAVQNRLLSAFGTTAQEPVPQRLLDTLKPAPQIGDLARARAAREAKKLRWTMPERGALAASILIAITLGYVLLRSPAPGLLVKRQGQLVAQGALAQTLSQQLASTQAHDADIRVGVSFKDKQGHYCRTFISPGQAGLACRENREWQVPVLAQINRRATGGAEQAGSALPEKVLRAVEDRIADPAFDAANERAARDAQWGDR